MCVEDMCVEDMFVCVCVCVVAEDCYTVGREAYKDSQWALTCEWMREALRKYDEEGKCEHP